MSKAFIGDVGKPVTKILFKSVKIKCTLVVILFEEDLTTNHVDKLRHRTEEGT